jgi:hypothetical protein
VGSIFGSIGVGDILAQHLLTLVEPTHPPPNKPEHGQIGQFHRTIHLLDRLLGPIIVVPIGVDYARTTFKKALPEPGK